MRLRIPTDHQTHPWVYRRTIKTTQGYPKDGDEVVVIGSDGEPTGRGFYHGRSSIAVRLISRDPDQELDEAFFEARIARALELRRDILKIERETDSYRVVHSEGDELSGLIIDRYDRLLVCEIFSKAFYKRRQLIRRVLERLIPDSLVHFKVPQIVIDREGIRKDTLEDPSDEALEERIICENKVRFYVSPAGHKTGFFLDQREHRARLSGLVKGAKFLDAFAYTGAFGLTAKTRGKARSVVCIDLDEVAVEQGKRNAELNRAQIEWQHVDAFKYLKSQRHAAEPFDVISVDPPKWVTQRDDLENAALKYIDINTYAMRAVRRGGLIVSSCCSGLVSRDRFVEFLQRSAGIARRRVEIFHLGGASADHPVDAQCPESSYLKTAFARVL